MQGGKEKKHQTPPTRAILLQTSNEKGHTVQVFVCFLKINQRPPPHSNEKHVQDGPDPHRTVIVASSLAAALPTVIPKPIRDTIVEKSNAT